MQTTRQHILEIIKESGEATVDDIVAALAVRVGSITAVTVRYHLDILRNENLVDAGRVRRRRSPGRPQYVYTLTENAHTHFPKNYQALTTHILEELKCKLPADQVQVIMESVAQRMAQEIGEMSPALPPRDLMTRAVDYLSAKGYQASWEQAGEDEPDAYLIRINNCPYHQVAGHHDELCVMDAKLITDILGTALGCTGTIVQGKESCTYKAILPN